MKMKGKKLGQAGFSLLEVLIALTVFAVFITVYVTSQGYNISDSAQLKEELLLRELCVQRIHEIIVSPPQLREALTLAPEVKTFEKNKNYEYSVEYKRFKIPDVKKILGKTEGDDESSSGDGQSGIETNLLGKIKENMQELIWQVVVTVKNKETKYSYSLSSWLLNPDAKLKNLDAF